MKYTIYRAGQKLWLHKKVYVFLLIEIALGLGVVLCGFHSRACADYRLKLYQEQNADGLNLRGIATGNQRQLAITVQDYRNIQKNYGRNGCFSYMILMHAIYRLPGDEGVQDMTIVSMNDAFFESIWGFSPQPEVAYLGNRIGSDCRKNMEVLADWLRCKENEIYVGEKTFSTYLLPQKISTLVLAAETEFDQAVSSMLILPESQLEFLEQHIIGSPIVFFRIDPLKDQAVDFIYDIARWLQDEHPEYQYQVIDQRLQMEKSIRELTSQIQQLSWFAKISLMITVVGLVGVLLIFLERRRREMAICRMLGATKYQLFAELFWEVFLLTLMGGILSILLLFTLIPNLSTVVFRVTFQWKSIFIVLGTATCITLISCSCAIAAISSNSPLKILRS